MNSDVSSGTTKQKIKLVERRLFSILLEPKFLRDQMSVGMNKQIKRKCYRKRNVRKNRWDSSWHILSSSRKNDFGKILKHSAPGIYGEKPPVHIQHGQETTEFSFVLKPSQIAGVGVFAMHDIAKGAILNFWSKKDIKFVKKEDLVEDTKFFYDTYCIEERDGFWCPLQFNRMSIAWYVNHSDLPNCDTDRYESRANRDIKAGEELTIDYRYLSAESE